MYCFSVACVIFLYFVLDRAIKLGQCAGNILPRTQTLEQASGPTFYTLGFLIALIFWSFGSVRLLFALAFIVRSKDFAFNIGWWGFTFPLGVFASSTVQTGIKLPSRYFDVVGTVGFLSQDWEYAVFFY